MKITEKQLLVMYEVFRDACRARVGMGGFSPETLEGILNQILNQQSDVIIDVKDPQKNGDEK